MEQGLEPESRRLKTMAASDRPQERLERLGPSALSDTELLALMLRSGSAKMDVLAVASNLLQEAGSLRGLLRLSHPDFAGLHGIGRVKGWQLVAVMELARRILARSDPDDRPEMSDAQTVFEWMRPRAVHLDVEKFWSLCLDRKNRLVKCSEVTSGTATASLVHPREVFREAIRMSASAIIVAHNHPSGDPQPSSQDLAVTRKLRDAGEVLCLPVLDHVIIGDAGYFSFAENGLLAS